MFLRSVKETRCCHILFANSPVPLELLPMNDVTLFDNDPYLPRVSMKELLKASQKVFGTLGLPQSVM